MKHLSHSILLLICLTVLFASFATSQDNTTNLIPKKPTTFSLTPSEKQTFNLLMNEDDFAEIIWLANDSLIMNFEIRDSNGNKLYRGNSVDNESLLFVAPRNDEYKLIVEIDKLSEITGKQQVSLEYNDKFKLPTGSKIKTFRKINDYEIRIINSPEREEESTYSFVLIQKDGKLKYVLKSLGGGVVAGFSIDDNPSETYSPPQGKSSASLIKNTLDKTGDKIPDVVIDYFSGGAHCCSETYFINLGETVELLDSISTGHSPIKAVRKNPNGGLIFAVNDTSYAYWLVSFANSPFPEVLMDFNGGKLRPNFKLMKKPPPSLIKLKKEAEKAKQQLSLEPYKGEDNSDSVLYKEEVFPENVFWGTMLDLIYTGNDELAWQFLDSVWDTRKQGKEIFIKDFKNQLAESPFWEMIEEDKNKR